MYYPRKLDPQNMHDCIRYNWHDHMLSDNIKPAKITGKGSLSAKNEPLENFLLYMVCACTCREEREREIFYFLSMLSTKIFVDHRFCSTY